MIDRKIIFGLDYSSRYERLKECVDMVGLLEEIGLTSLREVNSEIWACCPYHDDTRPSWSINSDSSSNRWGVHSCFTCRDNGHGSGNLVSLIRDVLELSSYGDALAWLEQYAGIDIAGGEELVMELALRKRNGFRSPSRRSNKEENPGYLYSSFRGIGRGSRPWRYLSGRGVSSEQIERTGVKVGSGRFDGRVAFPIYSGMTVSNFYARSYIGQKPKGLYAKKKGSISTSLWGYERANKLADRCYLVEGVFDALTVERLLGERSQNVFAVDGPVVHQQQAKLLGPFKEVVVIPDMTGSAKSLVPTAKKYLMDKRLFIVEPPTGQDIDQYGRREPDKARRDLLSPALLYKSRVVARIDYSVRSK